MFLGGLISGFCIGGSGDDDDDCDNDGAGAVAGLGLGMVIGFGLYDWIDAGRAVDRHNTRVAKSRVQLGVAPMLSRHSTGLMLGGRF